MLDFQHSRSVEWVGKRFDFSISFDRGLVDLFEQRGLSVDFDRGEIVGNNGRGRICSLAHLPAEEAAAMPPWIIYEPKFDLYGFPRSEMSLGLRDGKLVFLVGGPLATDLPELEPGRLYPISATWKDREYAFDLQITEQYADYMRNHYLWLDLASGELVQSHAGIRMPVNSSCAEAYEQVTGREPPPWLLEFDEYGLFGMPKGRLVLDRQDGVTNIQFDYLESDSYFRKEPGIGLAQDRAPIAEREWRAAALLGEYAPNITIQGQSEALILRAAEVMDQVIGTANTALLERLPALASERDELRRVLSALESAEDGALRDALTDEAKELLGIVDEPLMEKWDVLRRMKDRLGTLQRYVDHEIEVLIVPKGKHWSAMPQLSGYDTSDLDTSGYAANYRLDNRTIVFLLEDDLITDNPWISKHELHHLLVYNLAEECIYEEQLRLHAEARRNDGPFAREYGVKQDEFWTTFAELFEGRYGEEGRAWFAEKQPRLYELMRKATGRPPPEEPIQDASGSF